MKKTLIVMTSLMFLAPSIALAAWWNPFTWFSPKVSVQSVATTSVSTIATTTKIVQKKIISTTSVPVVSISTQVTTPVSPPIISVPSTNQSIILNPNKDITKFCWNENYHGGTLIQDICTAVSPTNMALSSVTPNIIQSQQLNQETSAHPNKEAVLTLYGANFWYNADDNGYYIDPTTMGPGGAGPIRNGPLIYVKTQGEETSCNLTPNNNTIDVTGCEEISADTYSTDGTSLTFSVPWEALPDAIADSSGHINHSLTFVVVAHQNMHNAKSTVSFATFTMPVI